ncbi:hypothetical protein HY230_08720 [Candidatus Acetothermia bacterium]|nr:hypothetical protein [Candidatus Acetothermia bacterium]
MLKYILDNRIKFILLFAMLGIFLVFTTSQAQSGDGQNVNEKIERLGKAVGELEALVKSLELDFQKTVGVTQGDVAETSEGLVPRLLAAESVSKDLSSELKKANLRLAQVEATQKKLSKLPQLNIELKNTVSTFGNQIRTNEQAVAQLQQSIAKLSDSQMQVINLQSTVSTLSRRLDTIESTLNVGQQSLKSQADGALAMLKAQTDLALKSLQTQNDKYITNFQSGLKTTLKDVQEKNNSTLKTLNQVQSYQTDLTNRLSTIDSQIKGLQDSVAALALRQEQGESTVLELRTHVEDLSARSEKVESHLSQLQDMVTQISGLQPVVASLQDQINRLSTKLDQQIASTQQGSVAQSQFSTVQTQVVDLRERLAALQNKIEDMQKASQGSVSEQRIARLQEAVGQILIESQANKIQINQLDAKLTALRTELKLPPTGSTMQPTPPMGTQPTVNLSEDLEQRLKKAEQTAKDAKSAVDTANTIAIIALLAGLAGIAIGLLLP